MPWHATAHSSPHRPFQGKRDNSSRGIFLDPKLWLYKTPAPAGARCCSPARERWEGCVWNSSPSGAALVELLTCGVSQRRQFPFFPQASVLALWHLHLASRVELLLKDGHRSRVTRTYRIELEKRLGQSL